MSKIFIIIKYYVTFNVLILYVTYGQTQNPMYTYILKKRKYVYMYLCIYAHAYGTCTYTCVYILTYISSVKLME